MVLKIDHDTVKLQKIMTSFYDIIKITSPKTRHKNDVTILFYFQAPPLAKSWLRFCMTLLAYLITFIVKE